LRAAVNADVEHRNWKTVARAEFITSYWPARSICASFPIYG
jgi:hypothetical protein